MPASRADRRDPMAKLRGDIRRMVLSALPAAHAVADDESLFEVAGFDSLAFIAVLRALERRYTLSLSSTEVALADFSSIGSIARYVESRGIGPPDGEPADS